MRGILIALIAACGGSPPAPPVAPAPAPPTATTARPPAAADPDARDGRGWTPLMSAAVYGDLATIDALLARGAAIDASSPKVYDGATAFVLALHFSRPAIAKHLLERGASYAGRLGTDGIALAAREGADDVIDFLLARGVAVTGSRALAMAAKFDHPTSIAKLVAADGDVNGADRDDHDFTPLMVAAMENRLAAARGLLDAGARVDLVDNDGSTALHWAVFGARPHEIHEYPEGGGPHDTYWEPQKSAPLVELLIARGAKVDALDRAGNTPLHQAARLDAAAAARVLVAAGASRTLRNGEGKTAHDLAKARGNSVVPIVR